MGLLNLRNALMSGKKWKNPYQTPDSALVAMWDGEWNAGGGKHDASTTTWKDLVGDVDLTAYLPKTVHDKGLSFLRNGYMFCNSSRLQNIIATKAFTLEIICNFNSYGATFFGCGNYNWSIYNVNASSGYIRVGGTLNSAFISAGRAGSVAFSFEPNVYYANGVAVSTFTVGNVAPSSDLLKIGGRDGSGMGADDLLNSARIYSRALTASEIAARYATDKERFGLP